MPATPAAQLLQSLDLITAEIVTMLDVLDTAPRLSPDDRREAKRRVMEMRARAQEVFEWVRETRLGEPTN